jgi:hypothetical protein
MDQDVTHRVSAPSGLAGKLARYSLVWKLLFIPKPGNVRPSSIARPEWGEPIRWGGSMLHA